MLFSFSLTALRTRLLRGKAAYNNLSNAFFAFDRPFCFGLKFQPAMLIADNLRARREIR